MFWLFITMGLCGISQWFDRRLAASIGALLVFGCLTVGVQSRDKPMQSIMAKPPVDSTHFVALSTSAYHRPGCPMIAREVEFATSEEAARVRKPCPFCVKETIGQSLSHYMPRLRTKAD